ncbi:MAG: DUF3987 domain-containing protein, partial [Mediterranea sp.]|nr:DUF3987 domain-containing protein [Mediterranea sp.]
SYIFRHPLIPGQRNANLYRIACEAARDGWDEGALRGQLWSVLQGTDFTYDELSKTVSNGYQSIKSDDKAGEAHGGGSSKVTKVTKVPYDTFENDNDGEEAYWEGEELRKRTPLFPESVYENLPELLEDAIPDDCTPRQRDVALLAQLVSVGAALPGTWGRYNRRNYSPHLYGFVIAPAGSGKSIAETGRTLLKNLHERVETLSKMESRAYEKSLREWKERGAERSREAGKSGAPAMEQPERPPYRSLLIPANTSAARLYLQLRDNGDMGGVIFDTEAQTLANANGMDYGHFDDILRKCFEHERIDYSYKAAGMEPIVVPRPKLALLLTGTAQQYAPLLQNSENGLASRALFYTWREDPRWVDVGEGGSSYDEQYLPLAGRMERLHDFCDAHPATFHLTPGQWRELNRLFARKLADMPLERNDNLQAVVKRYACVTMRLAMTLTRLRQAEAAHTAAEIDCRDDDFRRALDITLCCYEHARLVMSAVPTDTSKSLKDPDMATRFFDSLPDQFTTAQALEAGRARDFCKRKVMRMLKAVIGRKIRKLRHGAYQKLNPEVS